MAKQLTAAFVKTISRPGKYNDEHGLILRVQRSAKKGWISKSWVQRIVVQGRRREIGLGAYPLVALAQAREQALRNRTVARSGGDPFAVVARAPTFAEALETVIAIKKGAWKSGNANSSEMGWRSTMREYVLPTLGERRVDSLTTSDVLAVIAPIWHEKNPTALAVLHRIGAVCRWAVAEGYRVDDPTANVMSVLPRRNGEKKHHEAMAYQDVGAFLVRVRQGATQLAARLAFEFMVLTVTRTSEVRLMRWSEVDIDGRTWTIPGDRMKAGKRHRVPLSDRAITMLSDARLLGGGEGYVFLGCGKAGTLSRTALRNVMRKAGESRATPHGMRSAFRDWCSEQTDTPHAVIEASLAHTVRHKAEAAYARSDLYERRRALMRQWAAYLQNSVMSE